MTQRSKRWTWTLNNPDEEQKQSLKRLLTNGLITYVVWGEEIAPTTGTPHLQGYMEVAQKKTMKSLQKVLQSQNIRLSLRISKGSAQENRVYCLKDGVNSYEEGQAMKQGKRSDLEEVVQSIREGSTIQELWERYPQTMIVHRRGIAEAVAALQTNFTPPPPFNLSNFDEKMVDEIKEMFEEPPKTLILWGDSNTGKTTLALNFLPRALLVSHIDDLRNFKEGVHEGIVFDDMNFTHIPREAQIHLTDWDLNRSIHIRYGTGFIPRQTPKIFTTNVPFGEIFLNDPAIRRRTKKYEIKKRFI